MLDCFRCHAQDIDSLRACPQCLNLSCMECIGKSLASKTTKNARKRPTSVGHTVEDEVSQEVVPCPHCTRKVSFLRVTEISPIANRLCEDLRANVGEAALECVICCDLALTNSYCPTCLALYCTGCFEQWERECGSTGEVSCGLCRTNHETREFPHDRFAAKIAFRWSKQRLGADKTKLRRMFHNAAHQQTPHARRGQLLKFISLFFPRWRSLALRSSSTSIVLSILAVMFCGWMLMYAVYQLCHMLEEQSSPCDVDALPPVDRIPEAAQAALLRSHEEAFEQLVVNELMCSARYCHEDSKDAITYRVGGLATHALTRSLRNLQMLPCGWSDDSHKIRLFKLLEFTVKFCRHPWDVPSGMNIEKPSKEDEHLMYTNLLILHFALEMRLHMPSPQMFDTWLSLKKIKPDYVTVSDVQQNLVTLEPILQAAPELSYLHLQKSHIVGFINVTEALKAANECINLKTANPQCFFLVAHWLKVAAEDGLPGHSLAFATRARKAAMLSFPHYPHETYGRGVILSHRIFLNQGFLDWLSGFCTGGGMLVITATSIWLCYSLFGGRRK